MTEPKVPYGVSDYGEAEERLRVMMGLEGTVPVEGYLPAVTPVVLLQDGTLPGVARRRGARWLCRLPPAGTPANATYIGGLLGTDGVILEGLLLSSGAAAIGSFQGSWNTSGTAATTPSGVIADRVGGVNPVATGVTGLSGVAILRVDYPQVATQVHQPLLLPIGIYLGPGQAIGFTHTAGTIITGMAWGRLP